jgi:hypothetical protein
MPMWNKIIMCDLRIPRSRLIQLNPKPPEHRRQRQIDLSVRQINPQTLSRALAEVDKILLKPFRRLDPAIGVELLRIWEFDWVCVLNYRCHGYRCTCGYRPFVILKG